MPNPPGAENPLGGMGGGGMAAAAVAGGPAAGGCLNGTCTEATFASGSLHRSSHNIDHSTMVCAPDLQYHNMHAMLEDAQQSGVPASCCAVSHTIMACSYNKEGSASGDKQCGGRS